MSETITENELFNILVERGASAHTQGLVKKWLERGDGCAVYENMDLWDPNVGHMQFCSYGSQAAQLEVDEPPDKMPDIGSSINWRYRLKYTCRPSKVPGEVAVTTPE